MRNILISWGIDPGNTTNIFTSDVNYLWVNSVIHWSLRLFFCLLCMRMWPVAVTWLVVYSKRTQRIFTDHFKKLSGCCMTCRDTKVLTVDVVEFGFLGGLQTSLMIIISHYDYFSHWTLKLNPDCNLCSSTHFNERKTKTLCSCLWFDQVE